MTDFMKFWPIVALALSLAGMAVTGWFQIQANAEDLVEHIADAGDDQTRLWGQVRSLLEHIESNEEAIDQLERGDDAMGAKLELEILKLQNDIEKQSAQLDTILRLLQQ